MSTTTAAAPKPKISLRGVFPTLAGSQPVRTVKRATVRNVNRVTYHSKRLPTYWTGYSRHAYRGAPIAAAKVFDYVFDGEGRRVKKLASKATDETERARWLAIREAHKQDRNARLAVGGSTALVTAAGFAFTLHAGGPLSDIALLGGTSLVGLPILGAIGKPEGERIVHPAFISDEARDVTDSLIIDALANIGVASLRKAIELDRRSVRFIQPTARKRDRWETVVELPGVPASVVIEKLEAFAANLPGRSTDQVIMKQGNATNRVEVVVSDLRPSERPQQGSPFLDLKPLDLFDGFVLGFDELARPVKSRIMGTNILIGGVPESGKSSDLQSQLSAVALDPRAEIFAMFDFKGNGDLDPFEPIARFYGVIEVDGEGESNEREVLRSCIEQLRAFKTECHRRATRVRKGTNETKVTSAIADENEDLRPIVFVIDEIQELILDDEFGPEARELLPRIAKLCRAQGASLIYATQTPTADSLPSELRKSTGRRFCHRVLDHETNDRVLPDGSYKAGVRATTIGEDVPGTAIMATSVDSWVKFRFAYLSDEDLETIVTAGVEFRGGPVAKFVPLAPATPEPVLRTTDRTFEMWFADILTVTEGEERVQLIEIYDRLQEAFPARYQTASSGSVKAILEGCDVPIVKSMHKKRNGAIDPETGERKHTSREGVLRSDVKARFERGFDA